MKAQHIALVLHDFPPGGSERIAIRLANEWSRSGRRVTILCGTEKGVARSLVSDEIKVFACRPDTPRTPWSRFQLGARIATLVREHQPDVVFAPGNFHLIVLARLARQRFARRPAFVCKLSNPVHRSSFGAGIDRLVAWLTTPVDVLVAMSERLAVEAHRVFPSRKVQTIYEPILDDDFRFKPSTSKQAQSNTIICAGRLNPQKDFLTALRAFSLLADRPELRLVLLGEGPMRKRLEREATKLGIADRISMPGHVPDIAPWLSEARLFLMSSRFEGYPAVLVEAIVAGVPIVTTHCSDALPEILLDPTLGTIASSRSPRDLAEAIAAQLSCPMPDPAAALRLAQRHRMNEAAAAYLALFDRIAA